MHQSTHKSAQHNPETQETQTVDEILTDFFEQFITQKPSRLSNKDHAMHQSYSTALTR